MLLSTKLVISLFHFDGVNGSEVDSHLNVSISHSQDELVACIKAKICDYYYDPEDIQPEVKPSIKRKQPEYPSEDPVVRKACKIIDSNVTVSDADQIDMNVTETTLSQLPFVLESKENTFHCNGSENADDSRNISVSTPMSDVYNKEISSNSGNISDRIDTHLLTSDQENNYSGDMTEQNETYLPTLDQDSLNDIVPYDDRTDPTPDSGISLDNEISRTQWSKGNVVINGKLLGEPIHVPVNTENLCETHGMEEYSVKTELECSQDSQEHDFNEINENTLYFQSGNEDSPNQTEDISCIPGTPEPEPQVESFSTFAKDIRQDMLQNKGGMTFGKVASQVVTKLNNLQESGEKGKSTKPAVKAKEISGTNKSMLEFVNKKLVRSYPSDETISLSVSEVKLRMLEKSRQKEEKECDLSSEESDVGEETDTSHEMVGGSGHVNVGDTWTHLVETSTDSVSECNPVSLSIPDSPCIHAMVLKKHSFRLIGYHDENWYYMCNKALGVLNVQHLHRIVTFHKYLRTYRVPSVHLEDCIMLDTHFLHTVLGLDLRTVKVDSRDQNKTVLKPYNELFALNGVGLLIRKNHSKNEYSILISERPKDIPAFSSKDAVELLNLGSTHKLMEACRPEKVQKLIQKLTEEYCATHPLKKCEEVITELMAYWFEHVRCGKYRFLYDRKVLHELYLLPKTL